MKRSLFSFALAALLVLQYAQAGRATIGLHLLSPEKTRTFPPTAEFIPDLYSINLDTEDLEQYVLPFISFSCSLELRKAFLIRAVSVRFLRLVWHRARAILSRLGMRVISKEGSLDTWYLATPIERSGTRSKVRFLSSGVPDG